MVATVKPRIALISVHGDPAIEIGKEEAGGQNVYVRQVGEALGRQGWQVDMFTRKVSPEQETIVQHSPNCRTIRLVAGEEVFIPRDQLFEYLPEFVDRLCEFQAQNNLQYSLVHTNYWLSAWVGMELKKRLSVKQIHTYHSLGAVKYKAVTTIPMIATTRLQVEKMVLETAERVVATSPQEEEHMRSLVSTKGKVDVIPCGTDIQRFGAFSRQEARQTLGLDPHKKIVLYVGRFDPRKGIETIVRAVSQSRHREEIQLVIGGGSTPGQSDGKERDRIGKIVNELGMAEMTLFPGRLGGDTLPAFYAAADVCVVPSHYEPFGLVAIEAMASRTPVVASDVGGLQYTVVSEETGLLAPPRDNEAFAEAIDRLLDDANWRNQLGENAQRRVQEMFSWEGVASQLGTLYQGLEVAPQAPVRSPVSA